MCEPTPKSYPGRSVEWLPEGGQAGQSIRGKDWNETSLGTRSSWCPSLKTATAIILNANLPMLLLWGTDAVCIYNDAFSGEFDSSKPFRKLGQKAPDAWPRFWETIAPGVMEVMTHGRPHDLRDQKFRRLREGTSEDSYWTFHLSPIGDEFGQTAGVLVICTDRTGHVVFDRRRKNLYRLGEDCLNPGPSAGPPFERFGAILQENSRDIPFALIYAIEHGDQAWLAAAAGIPAGTDISPIRLSLRSSEPEPEPWPLKKAAATGRAQRIEFRRDAADLSQGLERTGSAYVLPVTGREPGRPLAILVLGIDSRRPFDKSYREYFRSIAHLLGGALASAARARPALLPRESSASPRVLIAANDWDRRSLLFRLLAKDYEVEIADDTRTALKRIESRAPDVLLVETDLPASDGIGLLNALPESPSARPVVIVLAPGEDDLARPAAGAVDQTLAEPFTPGELLALVAGWIRHKRLRERFESALTESENRLSTLGDHAPFTLWIADAVGQCRFVNPAWSLLTGESMDRGLGTGWLEAIRDDDRARVHGAIAAARKSGEGFQVDYRIRRADGQFRWVSQHANPLFCGRGKTAGFIGSITDITELKHAEEQRQESERRLAVTLGAANLGAWRWNVATGEVNFNERWAEMLGYSLHEIEPRISAWEKLVHPEDVPGVMEALTAHLEGRTPVYRTEHRLRTRRGAWIWVQDSGQVYARDAQGRPLLAAGVNIDISARKRLEEEVRHQERELQLTMDATPALMSYLDLEFRYRRINQRYADWFGLDPERVRGQHARDILGEQAWQFALPYLEKARAGETAGYQREMAYRNGPNRWVEATYTPDRDAGGKVRGIVIHVLDIGQRKQAELALAASERRYRTLVETLPIAVCTCNAAGRIDLCNQAAVQLLGNEPSLGKTLGSFGNLSTAAVENHDGPARKRAGSEATGVGRDIEIVGRDGSRAIVRPHAQQILDADGTACGSVHALVDITAIREAEQALRRHANRQDALLQVTRTALRAGTDDTELSQAIFAAVRELCEVDFGLNHRFEPETGDLKPLAWFGLSEQHVAALRDQHPADAELRSGTPLLDSALAGLDLPEDLAPGTALTSLPVADSSGKLLGNFLFGSHRRSRFGPEEIRFFQTLCHFAALAWERRQAETALRAADRRKDEFLAMLAHELRSPLAPIRNGVEILRRADLQNPALDNVRKLIDRQVTHLSRLIDDLLDVSRITRGKVILQMEPVTLQECVERALEWSHSLIASNAHELRIELPDSPVPLTGDPTRLAQIFANLLNNAAKYTPPSGLIELTAYFLNGAVAISIRDNGQGIPPDLLPHVFDLFTQGDRSLDRAQGGLGIGLTLVKNLVELHGGTIEARSGGSGHGSEFILRLPLAEKERPMDFRAPSQAAG